MPARADGEQTGTRHEVRQALALGEWHPPVFIAVDHQGGTLHAPGPRPDVVVQPGAARQRHDLAGAGEGMANAIFEGLGGMRLGEHHRPEGVQVRQPVVAHLGGGGFSAFAHARLVEQPLRIAAGDDHMRDPLGLLGGQAQRQHRARRGADNDSALDPQPVEDGAQVPEVGLQRIGRRPERAVRPAAARQIHHQDAEAPRQVRYAGLERIGRGDLIQRREAEPWSLAAEDGVPGAHAVERDPALFDRVYGFEGVGFRKRGTGRRLASHPPEILGRLIGTTIVHAARSLILPLAEGVAWYRQAPSGRQSAMRQRR
jgi:hypothetical protein